MILGDCGLNFVSSAVGKGSICPCTGRLHCHSAKGAVESFKISFTAAIKSVVMYLLSIIPCRIFAITFSDTVGMRRAPTMTRWFSYRTLCVSMSGAVNLVCYDVCSGWIPRCTRKVHFHVADVSLRCHDNPIHVYHALPLNKKSLHSFLTDWMSRWTDT